MTAPDLTGMRLQAAVQRATELGLRVSVQYVPGRDRLGTVRAQFPVAGVRMSERARLTLNASWGAGATAGATVPDLGGRTLPEAVVAANRAGLRVIYLKRPARNAASAGEIVEQTPRAGSTAPRNGQVLVYPGVREQS